jgi:integrase
VPSTRTLPACKLTDLYCKNLKPDLNARLVIVDSSLRGFALRVTQFGARSFSYRYRFRGKQVRVTWPYRKFSLSEAREEAGKIIQAIAKGIDPRTLAAAPAGAERTLTSVAEKYFTNLRARGRRSADERQAMIKRDVLPTLGTRQISAITRRDLRDNLEAVYARACTRAEKRERDRAKIEKRPPDSLKWTAAGITANRLQAYLHALFRWAVRKDYLTENPCAGIEPLAPENKHGRDRVLSDREIKAIWDTCTVMQHPQADVVKLLLLTGQRLTEVSAMHWSEVLLASEEISDEWLISGDRTKNKRPHIVPIIDAMRSIIADRPRIEECSYVFTSRGERPVSGFAKIKIKIDRMSGITGWRLHDLRRTVASGMAQLRVPPHVVEAVLNHATGIVSGIAAVYNRYDYLDEKRHALEAWAEHVRRAVNPPHNNAREVHTRPRAVMHRK